MRTWPTACASSKALSDSGCGWRRELLFQVLDERSERSAIDTTTNLPFGEWTKVFPEPRLCKAVFDRLTFNAHIVETGTDSWRFKKTIERGQKKGVKPRRARSVNE